MMSDVFLPSGDDHGYLNASDGLASVKWNIWPRRGIPSRRDVDCMNGLRGSAAYRATGVSTNAFALRACWTPVGLGYSSRARGIILGHGSGLRALEVSDASPRRRAEKTRGEIWTLGERLLSHNLGRFNIPWAVLHQLCYMCSDISPDFATLNQDTDEHRYPNDLLKDLDADLIVI